MNYEKEWDMKPNICCNVIVGNISQNMSYVCVKCRHCIDKDVWIKFAIEKGIKADLFCPVCNQKLFTLSGILNG